MFRRPVTTNAKPSFPVSLGRPSSVGTWATFTELRRSSSGSGKCRQGPLKALFTAAVTLFFIYFEKKPRLLFFLRFFFFSRPIFTITDSLFFFFFRSDKLKPFWLSITEKEKLPQLDFLASALLSRQTSDEYRRALARALRLKSKKNTSNSKRIVPFFGVFIRDLKATLSQNPSIVVVSSSENAVPVLRVIFN